MSLTTASWVRCPECGMWNWSWWHRVGQVYISESQEGCVWVFSKLRVSVLPLRIQAGRHGRNYIPHNTRYCLCCRPLDIEDEFHFICICSYFSELRRKYIKRFYYTNPSVVKYHLLLPSNNKAELVNLCKLIKESLSLRNQILNNTNWFWSITFILDLG